jgi:hypothetical protein
MTKLVKHVPFVALGLLVMAGSASATPVEVKVPFSFTAGGHALPAGQYLVDRIGNSASTMLIQGERGTPGAAIVMTTPASGYDPKGDKPVLTFKRGEKTYALEQIWESGSEGQSIVR